MSRLYQPYKVSLIFSDVVSGAEGKTPFLDEGVGCFFFFVLCLLKSFVVSWKFKTFVLNSLALTYGGCRRRSGHAHYFRPPVLSPGHFFR